MSKYQRQLVFCLDPAGDETQVCVTKSAPRNLNNDLIVRKRIDSKFPFDERFANRFEKLSIRFYWLHWGYPVRMFVNSNDRSFYF
jgi:hypothetical protein